MARRRNLPGRCTRGTPDCICSKLFAFYKKQELPLYRGTVAKTRLAELLGFSKFLPRRHRRCVENFDVFLYSRGHGTVWEDKVPDIRRRLEKMCKDNALPVNNLGQLNRTKVLKEFGLGRCSVSVIQGRAPRLKQLLDSYDTTSNDPTYSQYSFAQYENALRELLATQPVELVHGRKVNRKWICDELGIPRSALVTTPSLEKLVQEKQEEVSQSLRKGKTKRTFRFGGVDHLNLGSTPYSEKHRRVFDFNQLVSSYGLQWTEKLATAFVAVAANYASPKSNYSRTKHFLLWLADESNEQLTIVNRLMSAKRIRKSDFERAVLTYQQHIIHASESRQSGSRFHPGLSIIERLAHFGLFPKIHFPKTKRRAGNSRRNARPSLLEAVSTDADAILKISEDAASYRNIEFSAGEDAAAFARSLALERSERDDLPAELPEAIRVLCDQRLVELRKAATDVYEEWRNSYLEGIAIRKDHRLSGKQIKKRLDQAKAKPSRYAWSRAVSELFPKNRPDSALRNALLLIDDECGGVCPTSTNHRWGQFWPKLYRKVGGKARVQNLLAPPHLVASAVACLYLCESGANVAVATSLDLNALRPSRLANHVNIVGVKRRANNKPIFTDLPSSSTDSGCISAAEAIQFYRDASTAIRAHCDDESNALFVSPGRGGARELTEWQLRADMKAICNCSTVFRSLNITPSMIRPTVLLSAQLKNPTNLGVAKILAAHESDTTTMGYVRKLPYRVILEDRIRQFADTLQVLAADKLTDTSTQLRIGVQTRQRIKAQSRRTGMGVLCSNPSDNPWKDLPNDTDCSAVDRCVSCRKVIVVAEPESIADMILWRQGLERAESCWLGERYERWAQVWVPWQAFFQVVLDEKMARGELAAVKVAAQDVVESRMRSAGFQLPEPW